MNVRFHPPQEQEQYAEQVLAILLQAAIPQAKEQIEEQLYVEQTSDESRTA
ncbi:MAG: hypothetical protein K2O18_15510 [Oscillospiraceae bacterium]|nr:hypothetical protein [Oscillospiraceae bacterium]